MKNAITALFVLLLFPLQALACECEILPEEEVLRSSTLLFTGVLSPLQRRSDTPEGSEVFRGVEIYRGANLNKPTIATNRPGGDPACEVKFLPQRNYTVIARGTYETGYYTDECMLRQLQEGGRERGQKILAMAALQRLQAQQGTGGGGDLGAVAARKYGSALLAIHDSEMALLMFRRAAALSNNAPEDSIGQGEALLQLGRPREGLGFFDDVLEKDGANKRAWSGRYRALAQMTRWIELPEQADMTGLELEGATLSADLVKPVFRSAWWQHVNAEGRKLVGADFSGSLLSHVNFSGADLSGAVFARVKGRDINLSGANLTGADLRGADLGGANLRGAKMDNVLKDETTRLPQDR